MNLFWVILCLEVRESHSFHVYIHFFVVLFLRSFFLHTVILYQVFLSNTNNLHTVAWFQVFLSNINNFYIVIYFQVTNNNPLSTIHILKWWFLNSSMWTTDGTQTDTTTPSQSGPGSNDNEWQRMSDSSLSRPPELEPHHWMMFKFIFFVVGWIQSTYSKLRWQSVPWLTYWLILRACQPAKGYFMSSG